MGIKALLCLHQPTVTPQDIIDEIGFGPGAKRVEYCCRCAKCHAYIKVIWHRKDVTLVELPVLKFTAVYSIKARVSPALGLAPLPFSTYSAKAKYR